MKEGGSSESSQWWQKLWKLKIPPKICIFWWRVMNKFRPAKGELKRRHVAHEDHCEAYGEPGENLFHVAFRCSFAIRFWEVAKKTTGCEVPDLHPGSWTRDLLAGDRYKRTRLSSYVAYGPCGKEGMHVGTERKFGTQGQQ